MSCLMSLRYILMLLWHPVTVAPVDPLTPLARATCVPEVILGLVLTLDRILLYHIRLTSSGKECQTAVLQLSPKNTATP